MSDIVLAKDLIQMVRRIGATPPASLVEILDVYDAVRAAAAAQPDPMRELVAAYKGGKLTIATAADILHEVAGRCAARNLATDLANGLAPTFGDAFTRALQGDGGAELIEALRPLFDPAVAGIHAALDHFSADATAEQVIGLGPEAADAWQALPGHVRVLDDIHHVITLLARDHGLNGHRNVMDFRTRVVAFFADAEGRHPLEDVAYLMGGAPHDHGRGGRWAGLIRGGITLHLNTPAEARAIFDAYLDNAETVAQTTLAAQTAQAFEENQRQAVIAGGSYRR